MLKNVVKFLASLESTVVLLLILACTYLSAVSRHDPDEAGKGIYLGGALSVAFFLAPVKYVKTNNIKVAHPKNKFYDLNPFLGLVWLVVGGTLMVGIFTAIFSFKATDAYLNYQLDHDTFAAGVIITFFLFGIFLLPLSAYLLWSSLFYKEYVPVRPKRKLRRR